MSEFFNTITVKNWVSDQLAQKKEETRELEAHIHIVEEFLKSESISIIKKLAIALNIKDVDGPIEEYDSLIRDVGACMNSLRQSAALTVQSFETFLKTIESGVGEV